MAGVVKIIVCHLYCVILMLIICLHNSFKLHTLLHVDTLSKGRTFNGNNLEVGVASYHLDHGQLQFQSSKGLH